MRRAISCERKEKETKKAEDSTGIDIPLYMVKLDYPYAILNQSTSTRYQNCENGDDCDGCKIGTESNGAHCHRHFPSSKPPEISP